MFPIFRSFHWRAANRRQRVPRPSAYQKTATRPAKKQGEVLNRPEAFRSNSVMANGDESLGAADAGAASQSAGASRGGWRASRYGFAAFWFLTLLGAWTVLRLALMAQFGPAGVTG
jgi:hypothetical protein